MKLHKLILKNFKQHKSIDQDFSGNVIAIVGRNGAGKSNFLGSIYFALTGEQIGFNKSDLISWGETEGSVQLVFEQNGKIGKITRALHSTHATLEYDQSKITGVKKVDDYLSNVLNFDRDILKQAVFVRQNEIDTILFTEPRLRELAFQRLCGLGDTAKIHRQLTELINTLDVPINYSEALATAKLQYSKLLERQAELNANIVKLNALGVNQADTATIKSTLEQLEKQKQIETEYSNLKDEHKNKTNILNELLVKLQEFNVDDTKLAQLDTQILDTSNKIQATIAYLKLREDLDNVEKKLNELQVKPNIPAPAFTYETLDELRKQAEVVSKEYIELEANFNLYNSLYNILVTKINNIILCPVCDHPLADNDKWKLQTKVEKYKAELENKNPKLLWDKYYTMQAELNGYALKIKEIETKYNEKLTLYTEMKANITAKLNTYDAYIATINISDLETKIKELNNEKQRLLAVIQERERLKTSINLTKQTLNTIEQKMALLLSQYKGDITNISPLTTAALNEQINKTKALLEQRYELDKSLSYLTGMINETNTALRDLDQQIADLTRKDKEYDEQRKKLQVVMDVRDWFHYSNGPRAVIQSIMNDMTCEINKFLMYFAAPYSVIPSDEVFGFKCKFHNLNNTAIVPDASHLSGGQKIQLALAFRFANYYIFANRLGLLCLDEPTVFLDDVNIGSFCTLLEKMKEIIQQINLQVIISTHEKAVIPFADTVISLD